MKSCKVILCVFLIIKSTFGMGLISTFNINSSSSCCSEIYTGKINVDDNFEDIQNETEDKGCCEDSVCDCLCCGHVFTNKTNIKPAINYPEVIFKHLHNYKNNYLFKGVDHIWQPPQNV